MFPRLIRSKKSEEKAKKGFFLKNGLAVLEQLICAFNGDCNPIRSFSLEELNKATRDFNARITDRWNYSMYQGIHEDRKILVKVFMVNFGTHDEQLGLVANDIAIASRTSNHKNVLKLLGCCLETEIPMLVYEFPASGDLRRYISSLGSRCFELTWDQKLLISIRTANAVAYLHRGLPKTFIHRSITPSEIFLDSNFSPKLSDFQLAIPIPKDKTHVYVDEITGRPGFVAPETIGEGCYTEKSDVYSFGCLLLEVLTEKSVVGVLKERDTPTSQSELFEKRLVEEHCEVYLEDEKIRVQVLEYAKLALRCIEINPEDRPNMIQVEKALRHIRTI